VKKLSKSSKNQRAFSRGDYFYAARAMPLLADPLKERRIELLNRFFAMNSNAQIQAALDYVARVLSNEMESSHVV
jgi:hypothetical protein